MTRKSLKNKIKDKVIPIMLATIAVLIAFAFVANAQQTVMAPGEATIANNASLNATSANYTAPANGIANITLNFTALNTTASTWFINISNPTYTPNTWNWVNITTNSGASWVTRNNTSISLSGGATAWIQLNSTYAANFSVNVSNSANATEWVMLTGLKFIGQTTKLNVTINKTTVKAGQYYNVTVKAFDDANNTNTSESRTVNLTTNTSSALWITDTTQASSQNLVNGWTNFTVFSKVNETINITSMVTTDTSINGTSSALIVKNATAYKFNISSTSPTYPKTIKAVINVTVTDRYNNMVPKGSTGINETHFQPQTSGISVTLGDYTNLTTATYENFSFTMNSNGVAGIASVWIVGKTGTPAQNIQQSNTISVEYLEPIDHIDLTTVPLNGTTCPATIIGNESDLLQVIAQLKDSTGKNVNKTTTITWTIENTSILSFYNETGTDTTDATGKATIVINSSTSSTIGTSNITATESTSGKHNKIVITVVRGPADNSTTTATTTNTTRSNGIQAGQIVWINATIRDAQNRVLPNTTVSLSAKNFNSTGTLTTGGFNGNMTATWSDKKSHTETTDSNGYINVTYNTTRDNINHSTGVIDSVIINNITISATGSVCGHPGNVTQYLTIYSLEPDDANTELTLQNNTVYGNATVGTTVNFNLTVKDVNDNTLPNEPIIVSTNTSGATVNNGTSTGSEVIITSNAIGWAQVNLTLSTVAEINNNITFISEIGNVNINDTITGTPDVIDHINTTLINNVSMQEIPQGFGLVKDGSYNAIVEAQLKDQYNNNNKTQGINITYSAMFYYRNGTSVSLSSVNSGIFEVNDTTTSKTSNTTNVNGSTRLMIKAPNTVGWINGTVTNGTYSGVFNISVREATDVRLVCDFADANGNINVSTFIANYPLPIRAELIDYSGNAVSQQNVYVRYSIIDYVGFTNRLLSVYNGTTNASGVNVTQLITTNNNTGNYVIILAITEQGFNDTIKITLVNDTITLHDSIKILGLAPHLVANTSRTPHNDSFTVQLWNSTSNTAVNSSGVPISLTTTNATLHPLNSSVAGLNYLVVSTDSQGKVDIVIESTGVASTAKVIAMDDTGKNAINTTQFEGDAHHLVVSTNPTSVPSDGTTTANVSVRAEDANNNIIYYPVSNIDVTLSQSGNATLSQTSVILTGGNNTTTTIKNRYNETVTITATASGLTQNTTSITFTVPTTWDNKLIIYPNWNFISVPYYLDSSSDTFGEVFSGYSMTIYAWNASTQSWESKSSADKIVSLTDPAGALHGYWVKLNNTVPVAFPLVRKTFTLPTTPPPQMNIYVGWNAIGFTSTTAMIAEQALASIDNNYAMVLGWNASSQSYNSPIINTGSTGLDEPGTTSDLNTTLQPGQGYWIWATCNGTLIGLDV